MNVNRKLILASGSPRRREMIARLGIDFALCVPEIDESVHPGEEPFRYAARVAREKAEQIDLPAGAVVLAADTAVVCDDSILGKPRDGAEAVRMLKMLSGRTHQVVSGFCLRGREKEIVRVIATEVTFRELSAREIALYVASGEPMDKAGAYAIQDSAAGMVRSISGSYSNVVGLPLCEVIETLRTEFGFVI